MTPIVSPTLGSIDVSPEEQRPHRNGWDPSCNGAPSFKTLRVSVPGKGLPLLS